LADEQSTPRLDLYGDPLPAGAIARLGTVRLRPGGRVTHLAVSPDGKRLASFSEAGFSLWDPATGRELRRVELPHTRVRAVTWPADGGSVAVLQLGDDSFFLWDFADEKAERPPLIERAAFGMRAGGQDNEYVSGVAVSPDGKRVAAGHAGWQERARAIHVWQVQTGRRLSELGSPKSLGPQEGNCTAVSFSPDSRQLLAFSKEKEAKDERLVIYELSTGARREQFSVPPTIQQGYLKVQDISLDGRTMALGLADGAASLIDLTGQHKPRSIGNHVGERAKGVCAVAFSPDGSRLVTAGRDQVVRLWDLATGQERRTLEKKSASWIETVAFAPDGKWLATAGQGGSIRIWDTATGADKCPLGGHRQLVWSATISPDGKSVATFGFDETLRFWDLSDGSEKRRIDLGGGGSGSYTPDGKFVLVGVNDKIRIFDANSGEARELPGELAKFSGLLHGFSSDSRTLLTSAKGVVNLWDWPAGRLRRTIELPAAPHPPEEIRCTAASLSPDGRVLITNSERHVQRMVDGMLQGGVRFLASELWDTRTGQRLFRLENSPWYGKHAFTQDGRFFVLSGSGSSTSVPLALWDPATGTLRRAFAPPKEHKPGPGQTPRSVRRFALAPNGWTLATAEDDGSVLIYEMASGHVRRKLTGHRGAVLAVAYTADSRRLLTGSADNTSLLWDVTVAGSEPKTSDSPPADSWSALAGEEAEAAYRTMTHLAAQPGAAVTLLKKHLKPATGLEEATLKKLFRELDAAEFAVRERAAAELDRLGKSVLDDARTHLAQGPSPEVRRRLTQFLEKHERPEPTPDEVREARCLELLEHLASPEAKGLLQDLSKGHPTARLTQQATAALRRHQCEGNWP
jgi:WD40 repeat protein